MKRKLVAGLLPISLFLLAGSAAAQGRQDAAEQGQRYAPDDTGVNKRDRLEGSQTADEQSLGGADAKLAARIRRAVTEDDSLSTDAHNVKIIVENGRVTLRGPVKNREEQEKVGRLAQNIAGSGNVTNQTDIARG